MIHTGDMERGFNGEEKSFFLMWEMGKGGSDGSRRKLVMRQITGMECIDEDEHVVEQDEVAMSNDRSAGNGRWTRQEHPF